MSTAWSHLPNAAYIDRVLASVAAHPTAWNAAGDAAWDAALDAAAGNAARNAAKYAAGSAAWVAVRYAAGNAAWVAARNAAGSPARDVIYEAAWSAIAALIAWDDCAKYLDMSSDKLRVWGALSEDSACILLLPAVIAFEKINELELV